MELLKFTENWNNKLDCDVFTTIRLHNPIKYRIGKQFKLVCEKNKKTTIDKGEAVIIQMRTITLAQINEWVAAIDTGYSAKECQDIIRMMYKNKPGINIDKHPLDYLLMRKVKPPPTLF